MQKPQTRSCCIKQSISENGYYIIHNALKNPQKYLNELINDSSAHSDTMWNIRFALKKYFARYWGTQNLVSSFDGCSLNSAFSLSWHVDQNMTHGDGVSCIQGVLALTHSNSTDLLLKSHKHFNTFGKRCTSYNFDEFESYPIPKTDNIWKMDLVIYTPQLNPGDMLLFDSRLIHRVVLRNIRSVSYVSMIPRSFVSKDIQKKRQIGYTKGIQTTHWCSRFIEVDSGKPPTKSYMFNHLI